MNFRHLALTIASLAIAASSSVQAQGLRLSTSPLLATQPETQRQADYIVALVNSEPITNNEVRTEVQRLMQQFAQQGRPLPDVNEVSRQMLERLIRDKTQLQLAQESGIKVDETALDLAEQNIARQNEISVTELRRRLGLEGVTPSRFRAQLRDQIALTRLRERELESRVRVSDLEVDQYMQEQQNNEDLAAMQFNLSQILIAVPEGATPVQVAALQTRAQRALDRAKAGEDFVALVSEFSDASDKVNGGSLGLRTADRYPELFVQAAKGLNVGDISGLLRSGAGFHILKVMEKHSDTMPTTSVTQSRARHILLRVSLELGETAARDKLNEFRRLIHSGKADFAALAREHSQDGSADQGGDLGWANPGMFVPEFEEVMNQLAVGQLSEPLVSRFGVHLIQLMERRKVALKPSEQREAVRGMLRAKKVDEAYENWAQELRGRAYVEMREPPQ